MLGFVTNSSPLVAPISDSATSLDSRRARKVPVEWGYEQAAGLMAVIRPPAPFLPGDAELALIVHAAHRRKCPGGRGRAHLTCTS